MLHSLIVKSDASSCRSFGVSSNTLGLKVALIRKVKCSGCPGRAVGSSVWVSRECQMEIISLYPRGAVVQEWKWQGRRSGSVTTLPGAGCRIKISSREMCLYFLLKVAAEGRRTHTVCVLMAACDAVAAGRVSVCHCQLSSAELCSRLHGSSVPSAGAGGTGTAPKVVV